jgi:hypothetical protein
MKSFRTGVWVAAAALLIAGAVWASGASSRARVERATGTIQKVDTAMNRIEVKVGLKTEEFVLTPSTRISQGTSTLTASQLAAGQSVHLEWTMSGTSRELKSVEVVESQPADRATPASTSHSH